MHAERLHTASGTELLGPLLLTPQIFNDQRGWFFESWNSRTFESLLSADGQAVAPALVQDNHSCSRRGVLRGLHYQLPPHAQGKLVRCLAGEILDVAVDIRRGSPTFGEWVSAVLSATNGLQLWIPTGFAHGFLSRHENSEVLYKTSNFWDHSSERAIRWNDPDLKIAWRLEQAYVSYPSLAIKDSEAPSLAEVIATGDLLE